MIAIVTAADGMKKKSPRKNPAPSGTAAMIAIATNSAKSSTGTKNSLVFTALAPVLALGCGHPCIFAANLGASRHEELSRLAIVARRPLLFGGQLESMLATIQWISFEGVGIASSRIRLARVRSACTSSGVAILGAEGGGGGVVLVFSATVAFPRRQHTPGRTVT